MNLFKINYRKLAALLLPTFFRKKVILSFLQVVAKELDKPKRVYTRFCDDRDGNLLNLKYNCQVCYLRGALNNYFAVTIGSQSDQESDQKSNPERDPWKFSIEDCSWSDYCSYALKEDALYENGELLLERELTLKNSSNPLFFYDTTYRFVVYYPSTINSEDMALQMRELVDRYRLVGYKPVYKCLGEQPKKCYLSDCDPANCKYLRLLDPQKDRFVKPRDPSCVYWTFLDDPEEKGHPTPACPSCVYFNSSDEILKDCSLSPCDPSSCVYLKYKEKK